MRTSPSRSEPRRRLKSPRATSTGTTSLGIWSTPGLGPFIDTSTPVVAEGLGMFGTFVFDFFSGDMIALDVNTRAVVWGNFLPGGGRAAAPAYSNGTVCFSTWGGKL